MATTYSTNLQLIQIGTGEQAGTWGDTTNYNIGTLVEQAISGYATVSFASGDVTLTMDPGTSCSARNIYLELTGATAARTLTVPGTSPNANKKLYFIYNNSGYSITVKVAGQTGVTLTNGTKWLLTCNGTTIVPGLTSTDITMKNRIINGDMSIDQRQDGAPVTVTNASTNYFPVDRFFVNRFVNQPAYTAQRVFNGATAPPGFRYALQITAGTGFAGDSTSAAELVQIIEGYNFADMMFGVSNAYTFTISFWINCSVAGTYTIIFRNKTDDRIYPTTFTINTVNTWEYKTITVPGDVSGTWGLLTNDRGLFISIPLQIPTIGSSLTANTWQTPPATYTYGTTMLLRTTGATMKITGMQLEKNTIPTPFEFRPIQLELELCQRYYQNLSESPSSNTYFSPTPGNYGGICRPLRTTMRTNPTMVVYAGGVANRIQISDTPSYSTTLGTTSAFDCIGVNNAGTAGQTKCQFSATLDAEIG